MIKKATITKGTIKTVDYFNVDGNSFSTEEFAKELLEEIGKNEEQLYGERLEG